MTFTLNRDTSGVPVAAYNDSKDVVKVDHVRKSFRDDFPGSSLDTTTNWTIIQTGAGMTIAVSSGYLVISTGTTQNSETILRSKASYRLPAFLSAIVNLSQRIANQEFYIELMTADGKHIAGWKLDSTTATQGKYMNENNDMNTLSSAQTILTTASDAILEIEAMLDGVQYHSRNLNGARANNYVLHKNTPDMNQDYYIQIRAKNLGSSPSSTTDFSVDAVNLIDISNVYNIPVTLI